MTNSGNHANPSFPDQGGNQQPGWNPQGGYRATPPPGHSTPGASPQSLHQGAPAPFPNRPYPGQVPNGAQQRPGMTPQGPLRAGQAGAPQQPQPGRGPAGPPAGAAKKKSGGAVLLTIGVAVVSAAIAGALGFAIGANQTAYLDQESTQTSVEGVLTNDYGFEGANNVICPEQVAVVQGTEFQCTFSWHDSTQQVPVTIASTDGQLLVGSPVEGK